MGNDPLLYFRAAAGIVWIGVVIAGVYLARNIEKIVPPENGSGGENGAQRNYAAFLIFAVWAHAFVLSGCFALFLH